MADVRLSPPWYTFANEVKYTYGESPFITVNDLVELPDGNYSLVINVSCDKVATALRQVLPVTTHFGNITVTTIIFNSHGAEAMVLEISYTPEILAELFCTALKYNPLFVGSVFKPEVAPPSLGNVILVIRKEVVQFYNDDISDLCSNYNQVAAYTFANVTVLYYSPELKISFSTYDHNCLLQKDIFCPVKKVCGC